MTEPQIAHGDKCSECGDIWTGHLLDPPPHCGHRFELREPVELVELPEGGVVLTREQANQVYDALTVPEIYIDMDEPVIAKLKPK